MKEDTDLARFRAEVRAFLDGALTPELREQTARQTGVLAEGDLCRRWQRILHARGWAAPAWPQEYGGPGWSPMQRFIFTDECARAGAPVLPGMGLQMCGPVLMRYGTAEQKSFFLPRILSGEHYWCQGYSEPQSGSDLASLQMRAVRDGDDYVLTGSKIWTTHAHHANWMFLLVRTSNEAKPQAGITFLLTPMDTAGITVRPIISLSGEHEVNQVFFDDVRVPVGNRVGEENRGWTVAKALLEFERGGGAFASRLWQQLRTARQIAVSEGWWEGEPIFRRRWAELDIELHALAYAERETAERMMSGRPVGDATASRLKLTASILLQQITELAMDALGPSAWPDQREALGIAGAAAPIGPDYARTPTAKYLNGRAASIYGGSSEIQRNILARIILQG
jgi:alkylation response protein AidB-like acyl-CoA dehydrogenase